MKNAPSSFDGNGEPICKTGTSADKLNSGPGTCLRWHLTSANDRKAEKTPAEFDPGDNRFTDFPEALDVDITSVHSKGVEFVGALEFCPVPAGQPTSRGSGNQWFRGRSLPFPVPTFAPYSQNRSKSK